MFKLDGPVVKVETTYFGDNVTNAAPVILDLLRIFRGIFPTAKQLEASFGGVMDSNEDVATQEKRSKKLWRDANLSRFVCDKFTLPLCATRQVNHVA